MPPLIWKLAIAIVVGLGAGTVGGQSVIAGMAPPIVSSSSYPVDKDYASATDESAVDHADYRRVADACADCSDFDLGYRFAAARQLRSTSECADYSWSYQRGCLAYVREG